MIKYFKNYCEGIATIVEGMTITMSHLFRRPITVQYPDRLDRPIREMVAPRLRGFLKNNTARCTVCTMCERACPIDCIKIESGKDEALGRVMTRYDIDLGKCMYCGLCVDACPTQCLAFTTEFEGACFSYADLVRRFVGAGEKVVPYKPQKEPGTAAS